MCFDSFLKWTSIFLLYYLIFIIILTVRFSKEKYIIFFKKMCVLLESINDLFPFFMDCAKSLYPDELCEKLLSNNQLSCPPLWYLKTRKLQRRFVYHAGPTNSGKTHAALERYMSAEKAVYCAPLRMLAAEIYQRSNAKVCVVCRCIVMCIV